MSVELDSGAVSPYPDTLRGDPLARASYSSNPAFAVGASSAHPITSANKSQLAQPAVAEALEAVYISGLGEAQADEPGQIDAELAMSGLGWLRKHISEASAPQLKRSVIETKARLSAMEWSEQQQAERQQVLAEQATQRETERLAAAKAQEAKQTEQARDEARQAEYRAKLGAHVEQIREGHPELNFESYLGLCEELNLFEEHEKPAVGVNIGKEKRGFQRRLAQRAATYLENPQELVNDLAVIRLLHKQGPGATQEPTIYAYNRIIDKSIARALARSHYSINDFSPEIVNKWLEVAEAEKPDVQANSAKFDKLMRGDPGSSVADIVIETPAIIYGERIITNTFKEVARQHPDRLVDTMYMMAKAGLEPGSIKHEATTAFLINCLADVRLATPLLHHSTFSQNESLRRKAIDLQQTLHLLGVEDGTLGQGKQGLEPSVAKLSIDDLRTLYKLFKRELSFHPSSNAADHALMLDELRVGYIEKFIEWTTTSEGASNSLLARFSSQIQARKGRRGLPGIPFIARR